MRYAERSVTSSEAMCEVAEGEADVEEGLDRRGERVDEIAARTVLFLGGVDGGVDKDVTKGASPRISD